MARCERTVVLAKIHTCRPVTPVRLVSCGALCHFLYKFGSRNGHLIFDASGHGKPHAIVHGIAAGICFTVSLHWFFNIWVIRKALIKALGMGVVVGMSRFEIPGSCAGV